MNKIKCNKCGFEFFGTPELWSKKFLMSGLCIKCYHEQGTAKKQVDKDITSICNPISAEKKRYNKVQAKITSAIFDED